MSGRVAEISEPFTDYYALDANFDNWIIRKYAASEPTITLGPATPTNSNKTLSKDTSVGRER